MSMKERTKYEGKNPSFLLSIIKGSVIALSSSLLFVLVFAFLLKFSSIPESAIYPVNQVIKGISVFLGVFIGLKKSRELGLVSGFLIGLIYTVLAFLAFSLLAGNFVFDLTLFTDVIFGSIIGAICGIICVNLKKSTN